jgi:N-acetylmuramoyl-L-alanine amidase
MENVCMRQLLSFLSLLLLLALPAGLRAEFVGRVVIDPGHGGYDIGIRSTGAKEKEVTLALAKKTAEVLDILDRDVSLTRKIDHYLSIDERRTLAGREKPDVFLSYHLSDSDTFAVYVMWYAEKDRDLSIQQYYSISSRQRRYIHESGILAAVLEEALWKEFGKEVYHREMSLPALSSIGAPAVLIEFPSRGIDYKEELERVASAIAVALLNYEEKE